MDINTNGKFSATTAYRFIIDKNIPNVMGNKNYKWTGSCDVLTRSNSSYGYVTINDFLKAYILAI